LYIGGLDDAAPLVPVDEAFHAIQECFSFGFVLTYAVFDVAQTLLSLHIRTALTVFLILLYGTLVLL
jgi:hypothetical protein